MTIQWHQGTLVSAVQKAKQEKCVLLIFIEKAKDDVSQMYAAALQAIDFTGKAYLPIRIESSSTEYSFVQELYRAAPVPSVMLIDWKSGMLLDRIAGPVFDSEQQAAILGLLSDLPEPPVIEEPSSRVRIQLKLTSGETKTQVFAPADTLGMLRKETAVVFKLKSFELAVPYPRRMLTPDLDDQTLVQLGLCPSSTILVMPVEKTIIPAALHSYYSTWVQPVINFLRQWWQRVFNRNGPGASSIPSASTSNIKKLN